MSPNFTAIIPAAGVGLRLGYQQPKALVAINGEPILKHTLKVFVDLPELQQVVICCTPGLVALFSEALRGLSFLDKVVLIEGGETRQQSVCLGVEELQRLGYAAESIVAVHDAARCLVSQELIRRSVSACATQGAVSAAIPVSDSLLLEERTASEAGVTLEEGKTLGGELLNRFKPVPRENLWAVQTPQVFRLASLSRAHRMAGTACGMAATDDLSIVQAIEPISVCLGDRRNIKVTTVEDLEIAGLLLAQRLTTSGTVNE